MTGFFINVFAKSCLELVTFLAGLLVIGFILGRLEHLSNRNLWFTFGKKGILMTAWIGTPIHELSHLIMCFIFHHKVEKVKLIQFKADDGTLGYVIHRFNPNSLYQKMGNFFIGIAPILGGIAAVFLLMALLVPDSFNTTLALIQHTVENDQAASQIVQINLGLLVNLFKTLFTWSHLLTPGFWLFLLLSIGVSSHVSLSPEDIKGATSGIASLFFLIVLANSLFTFFQIRIGSLETYVIWWNMYLLTAGVLILLFALIHLGFSYFLRLLWSPRHSSKLFDVFYFK